MPLELNSDGSYFGPQSTLGIFFVIESQIKKIICTSSLYGINESMNQSQEKGELYWPINICDNLHYLLYLFLHPGVCTTSPEEQQGDCLETNSHRQCPHLHLWVRTFQNYSEKSKTLQHVETSWDRGIPETILIMLSMIFLLQRCPKHGAGRAERLLWDCRGAGRNEPHSSSRLHQETDD